jgi:hypothetical protein
MADHSGVKTHLKNDIPSNLPDSVKDVKIDAFPIRPIVSQSRTGLEPDEHLNIGPGIRYIYLNVAWKCLRASPPPPWSGLNDFPPPSSVDPTEGEG